MVTGDNKITAVAIAKEAGIMREGEENEDHVCMEGPEFCEFVNGLVNTQTGEQVLIMGKEAEKESVGNLDNMKIVRQKLKVLARSRPNDKYIMVAGLRQLGDIVAVTGDGTNDAPALRKADVGFAMKTGTQVAHSASDIIIQDDNFASIVQACKWGRNVYDNIRRFLQFQLTVNVVALITSFIGSSIILYSPLAAIQLLWVNLIMDSLASLALATETPKDDLLKRPPYRKKEYIISQKMVKHILGMSLYQSAVLFIILFLGPTFIPESKDTAYITDEQIASHPNKDYVGGYDFSLVLNGSKKDFAGNVMYGIFEDITPSRHLSVFFNIFVIMQIFNMIAARKINDEWNIFSGIWTNAMFLGVWIIILVGQFVIVQFTGMFFQVHVNGLTMTQWIFSIVISSTVLIFNFVLKLLPDTIAPTMGDENPDDVEAAKREYMNLRKTREHSLSARQGSFIQNKEGSSRNK